MMKIVNTQRNRFGLAAVVGLALALNVACQSSTKQEEAKTAEDTNAVTPQDGTQAQQGGSSAQQAPAEHRQEHTASNTPAGSQQGSSGQASGETRAATSGHPADSGAAGKTATEAYMMVNVPEGKNITVSLNEPISSTTSSVGDVFTATVKKDVQTREHPEVIIPAGSIVTGQIVEVQKAKQLKGQAKLVVKFDELKLPSGKVIGIVASLGAEGKDTTKRSVGAIAGGAAAGAILGKIIGHDTKDAAIGAVAGAAIGTGVVLGLDNKDVTLPAGTDLILNVDQQIEVPVAKSGA